MVTVKLPPLPEGATGYKLYGSGLVESGGELRTRVTPPGRFERWALRFAVWCAARRGARGVPVQVVRAAGDFYRYKIEVVPGAPPDCLVMTDGTHVIGVKNLDVPEA